MDEIIENGTVAEESNEIPNKENKEIKSFFSWIDDLIVYFVIFILAMSFVFRPVIVNGTSMLYTLYGNDVLILRSILYTPDYGDIIVVSREDHPDRPLVKRVIALGGDTVYIDVKNHVVYVNGYALKEDYVFIDPNYDMNDSYGKIEYPYTVPDDCVFVMGDNRLNSTDSTDVGAIENGQILGKAILRVYRDKRYGGSMFDYLG